MTQPLEIPFYAVITGVGECILTELGETGTTGCCEDQQGGGFVYYPIVPGEIAWDNCQCGLFTQSAGQTLWSDNSRDPIQLSDAQNNCGPYYVGMDITALILRCAPQPVGEALAPTPDALAAASQIWHADAAAIRRGVVCCLEAMLEANTIEGFQIIGVTPQGPQGACVGSQLTYRVWLPNCDCD